MLCPGYRYIEITSFNTSGLIYLILGTFYFCKVGGKDMLDLSINNMGMKYFSGEIFSNVNIELKDNERIALLGENGTGKSTIFRIICGEEKQSSGDMFIRKGAKVGLLRQIPKVYKDLTVKMVLTNAFKDLLSLERQIKELEIKMSSGCEDMDRILDIYSQTQMKYESLGGYAINERMSKICSGLKIDDEMLGKEYEILSGGEKTKIELAKILLEEADILLLDEPTNHLDIEMTEWLEEYLKTYSGSVLIISHDRYFLDNVIDKIYELKNGQSEEYMGNYSYYLEERVVRYENSLRMYNAQSRKIKQLEEASKRMREWGRRADNEAMFVKAKAIERRIEKMDKIDKPVLDTKALSIDFSGSNRSGKEVVVCKNLDLQIGDNRLLNNCEFKVWMKDRVGIIGGNGSGKSTLIKRILKKSEDDQFVKIGSNVKIGYLQQDIEFHEDNLDMLSVFKYYIAMSDGEIRNYLSRFKFYGEDVFKKVNKLSGGEKVRLMLSILMKEDINCMILDEPTNHIDIKTKEVLEEALESFDGTIIFISHDRFFLNKTASRIFEIEDKKLKIYEGDYEYYKNEKSKEIKKRESSYIDKKIKVKVKEKSKNNKVNETVIIHLEKEIEDFEIKILDIKASIELASSDYEKLQSLMDELALLEEELDLKMERYCEMQ